MGTQRKLTAGMQISGGDRDSGRPRGGLHQHHPCHRRSYSPSSSSKQLFHRLAISLWRGNACLWLHREHALSPRWMTSFNYYTDFIFYPLYTCSLHAYIFIKKKKKLHNCYNTRKCNHAYSALLSSLLCSV